MERDENLSRIGIFENTLSIYPELLLPLQAKTETMVQDLMLPECAKAVVGKSSLRMDKGFPLKLPYLSVFICLGGQASVQVNFEEYVFHPYDILVLSEDSLTVFSTASEDFHTFFFLADKELASEIAYKLPNSLFSYLWKSPLCRLEESEKPVLQAWMELALFTFNYCEAYKDTIMANHLQSFFLRMAERTTVARSEEIVRLKYRRKEMLCWNFWDLIGKHCKQYRQVAFYAQKLCITPFYLSQITKYFFNESPKGLIERQVILEMKAMLLHSDISVKEMAVQLNFDDASYMCRFFKRHTGISLIEYRSLGSRR